MESNLRENLKNRLMNGEFSCKKELTLSIISGKWKSAIVYHLGHDGTLRYGELKRRLDPSVSHRVLTKQLRELEQDGIIARKTYPTVPPRVDYFVTDMGLTLLPLLNELLDWGEAHIDFYRKML